MSEVRLRSPVPPISHGMTFCLQWHVSPPHVTRRSGQQMCGRVVVIPTILVSILPENFAESTESQVSSTFHATFASSTVRMLLSGDLHSARSPLNWHKPHSPVHHPGSHQVHYLHALPTCSEHGACTLRSPPPHSQTMTTMTTSTLPLVVVATASLPHNNVTATSTQQRRQHHLCLPLPRPSSPHARRNGDDT